MQSWETQLRKGAVELSVLALLAGGEAYGLAILERLGQLGSLGVAEGSVYPLLNRLQKDGKIASRWVEEAEASHPRKYYRLTEEGRQTLAQMRVGWARLRDGVDELLGEED